MGTSGESSDEEVEKPWSDREGWRGDQRVEGFDLNGWRERGESGWVWAEPEPNDDHHSPEHLAGPENWLLRRTNPDPREGEGPGTR
jgi:hypothetical protein